MQPNDVISLFFLLLIPTAFLAYVFRRYFAWKEKQLESDTRLAAEKAAQYAASNAQLEQRVRVLEQIVTDAGAETAAQIEALREPRLLKPAPAASKTAE